MVLCSGLYTPNLGALLLQDQAVNFQGLAVGDPCIHAGYQWPTYPDTLYGMGVIMQDERAKLRQVLRTAVDNLDAWQHGNGTCRDAFDPWDSIWNDDGYVPQSVRRGIAQQESAGAKRTPDIGVPTGTAPRVSLFTQMTGSTMTEDILLTADPASFDHHGKWFALPEVAKAFHIDGYATRKPADPLLGLKTYDAFVESGDFCTNSSYLYAELLASHRIDLMIYSSTVDPLLGPPTTEGGINAVLSDPQVHVGL